MSNPHPRIKWMLPIIESGLQCKTDLVQQCFDANKESILAWFKTGQTGSHQYFFIPTNSKQIECSDASAILAEDCRNCVYFVKNTNKAINLKSSNDSTLLSGNINKQNLVPLLECCISKVYQPMLTLNANAKTNNNNNSNSSGQSNDNWPASIEINCKNEFLKKGEQFAELLITNINNLSIGFIELPMPNTSDANAEINNLSADMNFDDLLENEEQFRKIRNCVQEWISNIWEYVRVDPSSVIQSAAEIHDGPKLEINFWVRRNLAITKCLQLLQQTNYAGLIAVLQQAAEEEAARQGTLLEENMNNNNDGSIYADPALISSPLNSPKHESSKHNKNKYSRKSARNRTTANTKRRSNDNKNKNNTTSATAAAINTANRNSNPLDFYDVSSAIGLYSAWKKIEQLLHEKNFEAKDNEKFLEKLLPFVEPFYKSSDIQNMIESLPSLFNNLKMIFTLSRYYNTPLRMSNLLTRITFQNVKRCKECIIIGKLVVQQNNPNIDEAQDDEKQKQKQNKNSGKNDASVTSLWRQPIENVIALMSECIEFRDAYKNVYSDTCKKLEEMTISNRISLANKNSNSNSNTNILQVNVHKSENANRTRQWSSIEASVIFNTFDKFIKRLEKLIDMFSSMQQFQLLESQHIDGLQNIILQFNKLVLEFKRKGHNLLDEYDTGFERDFVEFTMNNSHLENRIQKFIQLRFNFVNQSATHNTMTGRVNINQCLKLLNKFRLIFNREALQNDLDQKYMLVFKAYYKQLLAIQEMFIKQRADPPIGRNMTRAQRFLNFVFVN